MEERGTYFVVDMRIKDTTWAFNYIVRCLQYQKELKTTNKSLLTFSVKNGYYLIPNHYSNLIVNSKSKEF